MINWHSSHYKWTAFRLQVRHLICYSASYFNDLKMFSPSYLYALKPSHHGLLTVKKAKLAYLTTSSICYDS